MKKSILFCFFSFYFLSLSAQSSWEKHTAAADSLDLEKQFEESLTYRARAIESTEKQPDSVQKLLLGLQMFTQAEHDFAQTGRTNPEAYVLMQDAAKTLKKADADPERMSKVYRRLAENAFDYMYNPKDAEKHLETAFEYVDKSSEKDTLFLIEMMQFSGYMNILSRNYDKAIKTSEKALELFDWYDAKNNEDLELKAELYYNLSLVHNVQFLDIPQKEYQYTVESEKVLEKMEKPGIEHFIHIYRRLALFEKDFRNYQKAKGYMNKAMTLYEKHEKELRAQAGFKLELTLYRAYILILAETKEETEMLNRFAKVEQIVQNNQLDEIEKGLHKGILNDITAYYLTVNNSPLAKKYNHKALSVHLDSSKAPYSLESYNQRTRINEATISFLQKDYTKVIPLIAGIEKTAGFHTGLLLELKAKSLLHLNQLEEAVSSINELLRFIEKDNQSFHFPKSNAEDFTPGYVISDTEGLVKLAETFHNYYGKYSEEEEKLYWAALAQMENNIGNTPLNSDLKNTFDKIISGLINAALEREFSVKENNRLLNFMETVSSQELTNTFLLKREIAGSTGLYKLVEEEQYIRSYITFLKKEYQKNKDENTKQQLFEKELELKKVKEQIASQYQRNNLFTTPQIDITANSDKNIIKFRAAGNELFKIRLHNGKLTYQKIPGYFELKQEIENYLVNINNLNIPISELKKQGEMLFNKLFSDDFDTTAPTVIIPDDVLHYLPFDILVKDQQYLIENHIISYASNFYFLNSDTMEAGDSKKTRVVFFAPEYSGSLQESELAVRGEAYSLLGAEEEVTQISKFVSGRIYRGSSASKSNFKSLGSDFSVIHLAMHSTLNDEDPELSNLLFSNSEADYQMYISELYGLNFNADLVVLSACNTGVGGFKDGGNLVSMHNAFTTAGIPATVASLWNAPDQSTKEVMISFYKNLRQGQNKAEALQQAKLSYLKNTTDQNLQHPFYWAGFVLSGDESPVQITSPWKTPVVITVVSIITLLIILIFYFRNSGRKIIA